LGGAQRENPCKKLFKQAEAGITPAFLPRRIPALPAPPCDFRPAYLPPTRAKTPAFTRIPPVLLFFEAANCELIALQRLFLKIHVTKVLANLFQL